MLSSRLLYCSLGVAHVSPIAAQRSSPLVLAVSLQHKMQVLSRPQLSHPVSANARTQFSVSSAANPFGVLEGTPRILLARSPSSDRFCCQAKDLFFTTQRHRRAQVTMASAAPKPMGQKSPPRKPKGPSAVEGRLKILEVLPVESFKIAGVSFEDRQEFVGKLQPDQAIMMIKQPDNVYDPNAVGVQTLSGHDLGYVPKEHTARFPHDVTFGHVYSLGQNAKGLWGATVAVRPTLLPLTVDAFPANLATHINMSSSLPEEEWSSIRKATYKNANYMCEVSGGVGTEWPVECHELWRFDEGSQTLQLRGFMALHPEIHVAKHLERQQEDKRRQQAIWMLQAMNEWTVTEAEEYWKFARDTAMRRSGQEWKLDLSWLASRNYTIPPRLRQLCR